MTEGSIRVHHRWESHGNGTHVLNGAALGPVSAEFILLLIGLAVAERDPSCQTTDSSIADRR